MSDFKFACPECGQRISCDTGYSGTQFNCPACRKPLTVPAASVADQVASPVFVPVGQFAAPPPGALPPPAGSAGAPGPPLSSPPSAPAPKPSLWNLASAGQKGETTTATGVKPATGYSILAKASFLCSLWMLPGFIPGIICGHLARAKMRKNPLLKGREMATAGLAISYATLGLILAAFGIFLLMEKQYEPVVAVREAAPELTALRARVVDEVKPGPASAGGNEEEHKLLARGTSRSQLLRTNYWRNALSGGGFSYEMKVMPNAAMSLNCRYFGNERGDCLFDIIVDDQIVGTQELNMNNPNHYFDVEYKIPAGVTKGKTKVTVEFAAHGGMTAGRLFAVETLTR